MTLATLNRSAVIMHRLASWSGSRSPLFYQNFYPSKMAYVQKHQVRLASFFTYHPENPEEILGVSEGECNFLNIELTFISYV